MRGEEPHGRGFSIATGTYYKVDYSAGVDISCYPNIPVPTSYMAYYKLTSYGEQHLFDQVSIDYFAVSLPNFLVFEDDLQKRNQAHCYYMLGLGYLGLRSDEQARSFFQQVLALDSNHQGARIHLTMIEQVK